MRRLAITALAGAALAGCGDTQVDSGSFRSFERPVDLAMGCFGRNVAALRRSSPMVVLLAFGSRVTTASRSAATTSPPLV